MQRGGTLQERVPPCLCLAQTILPSSRREAETNGLVPSRLTAGQSLAKGFNLYAYPAGTSFCSCKRKQNTLGETPRPPTLDCAGYGYCFSAAAEKQIRTARRCAPKVACGGIFIARALEREGRTTTPLPSSKEGNYGGSRQILSRLLRRLCRGELFTSAPLPRPPGASGAFRSGRRRR